jgi:hypothetical protein
LPEGPTQLLFRHCALAVQLVPSGLSWHVVPMQRLLWQSPATAQVLFVPQSLFCASHCAPPQSTSVSLPSFTPSPHETHVPGPEPKQMLLVQSALVPQCFVSAQGLHEPPQSTSVSVPFCTLSVQLAGVQVFAVGSQTLLWQSAPTRQFLVSAQGPHEPPQSMSVSVPSLTPSVHCAVTQVPLPSHTVPPLSVHVVPFVAFVEPHVCAVASHLATLQSVVSAGQSLAARHATHVPFPSQTFPPLSVQGAELAAFIVPHAFAVHVFLMHAVSCAAQSVAAVQATHLPLPSQTLPLLSVQVVPALLCDVPQQPWPQVFLMQVVVSTGQSPSDWQVVPPSHIGGMPPMPPIPPIPPVPPVPLLLLELVLELLLAVLVELWAPPLPPPLPPPPGILDRSTAAMSSHPVVVAARVVAASRKAIKRLDVLFISVPCARK